MNHQRHRLLDFLIGWVLVQPSDRISSISVSPDSDEPPGRFGGKDASDQDGEWPDPLKPEGESVGPLGIPRENTSEDARGDELANDPAEVDVGTEVRAERDGGNLDVNMIPGRRLQLTSAAYAVVSVWKTPQGILPISNYDRCWGPTHP